MSTPIIAAIRTHSQLKGSLLLTALELAHCASVYGVSTTSASYLAFKTGMCQRTIFSHLAQLKGLGIVRSAHTTTSRGGWGPNRYVFLIPWKAAPRQRYATTAQILPPTEREGKTRSVREDIQTLTRALRFCTEGSLAYVETQKEVCRLQALLPPP